MNLIVVPESLPADPLAALRVLTDSELELDRIRRKQVVAARAAGASWQQIGDALGVTRQSAWESFTAETRAALVSNVDANSELVEIYPPNLYEEGLEAALTDVMARLDPRGIEATLTIDTPVSELSVDIAQLIYRAAQEGLRNVVAHANATRVLVNISEDADHLTLRVIDDGRGFNPEQVPQRDGHLGLRALAGFATSMSAEVMVESDAGRGTELRLEVAV